MNNIISIFCLLYSRFKILFLATILIFINFHAIAIENEVNFGNTILDKEFSGIAKVTDGDSIKIEEKRIRLLGIDAPEYSQNCFDENYEEYSCGKISKDFLIKLANNKEVKCHYAKFDKYNRFLSKCYIGEISINNEIIKNGMAVTYFFGNKDEEMINSENKAKEKKIGIWRGAFELPSNYRKSHKKS